MRASPPRPPAPSVGRGGSNRLGMDHSARQAHRDGTGRQRDDPGRRGAGHRELADDPTFHERGIRQTMKHPQVGDYVMSGWPVRFGGRPPEIGPAPLLGEHGEQVLSEWLGYDAARIADLKTNEVIG